MESSEGAAVLDSRSLLALTARVVMRNSHVRRCFLCPGGWMSMSIWLGGCFSRSCSCWPDAPSNGQLRAGSKHPHASAAARHPLMRSLQATIATREIAWRQTLFPTMYNSCTTSPTLVQVHRRMLHATSRLLASMSTYLHKASPRPNSHQ